MPAAASIAGASLARQQVDVTLEEVGEEDTQADPPANVLERQRSNLRPSPPSHWNPPTLSLPSSKANGRSSPANGRSSPANGWSARTPLSDSLADAENEVWREQRASKATGAKRISFQKAFHQNVKSARQQDFSALHGILRDQCNDFDCAMKRGSERVLNIFEEIVSENARLSCLLVAAGVPEQTRQGHTAPHSNTALTDSFEKKAPNGFQIVPNDWSIANTELIPEEPNKKMNSNEDSAIGSLVRVQPRHVSNDETTELTPVLPLESEDSRDSFRGASKESDQGKRTTAFCAAQKRTVEFADSSSDERTSELAQRYSSFLRRSSAEYNPEGGFKLLTVWQEMSVSKKIGWSRKVKQPTAMSKMVSKFMEDEEKEAERLENRDAIRSKCMIHPNSVWRATWDLLSLVMVVYDMAAIPFELFNPPDNTFRTGMMWIARIFWTIDMPLSLFSGYVRSDGRIELRRHAIIRHYLRTWFPLDIIIVGMDWLELVLQASSVLGFAKAGKAARVIRIIRMIRLLRLVRMREVFSMFTERITSEKVIIMLDICRLMLLILGIAHFFACLWYGVGDQDLPSTWIHRHGYHRVGLGEAYLMSLHWSLSQFAGGMDEITPKNESERLFTVVVFVFAFIMASVFVSSLTSSMTQLKQMSSHQAQQLSILRRYLRQHRISSRLGLRVQRSAVSALQERQRFMPEDAVQLLKLVSEPLYVEIHSQIYTPLLSVHPFFKAYIQHVPQVMRKVCHSATSFMMVSSGDVIFSAGESPPHPKMYFVVHGSLTYYPFDGVSSGFQELRGGHWVAEATLWTEWIHHGLLKAATECRLCVLDAKRFQNIVIQFEHSDFNPKSYATDFIHSLNDAEEVNDLPLANFSAQVRSKSAFDRVTSAFRTTTRTSQTRASSAGSSANLGSSRPSSKQRAGSLARITSMGTDVVQNVKGRVVRFVAPEG